MVITGMPFIYVCLIGCVCRPWGTYTLFTKTSTMCLYGILLVSLFHVPLFIYLPTPLHKSLYDFVSFCVIYFFLQSFGYWLSLCLWHYQSKTLKNFEKSCRNSADGIKYRQNFVHRNCTVALPLQHSKVFDCLINNFVFYMCNVQRFLIVW